MSLELVNISKDYETELRCINVLENVSLTIKKGEFICILGQSGCGKTTLLNIIAGFEKKSAGKILVKGKEINHIGSDRIMMFQEAALFPWMKVIDNVEFGLKMYGVKKQERKERALGYLSMVNLTGSENAYVHQLSGGMKQRVALARALAMDSEILLMDEPFSALDSSTKSKLRSELLKIWKSSRKTILFVTHDVEEALLLADRIIIMSSNPGRIRRKIEVNIQREERKGDKSLINLAEKIKEEFEAEFENDEN